jgi:UDP-glucoronosyl and UDP-glucosyl transferase
VAATWNSTRAGIGGRQVRRWLPQNDLLAHNKTLALVTHGGINSVYEVRAPLLVLPSHAISTPCSPSSTPPTQYRFHALPRPPLPTHCRFLPLHCHPNPHYRLVAIPRPRSGTASFWVEGVAGYNPQHPPSKQKRIVLHPCEGTCPAPLSNIIRALYWKVHGR